MICYTTHMLYFAYGSNISRKRLEDRVGPVVDLGLAKLAGYKIIFHKKSSDGSGKANIVEDKLSIVLGVIYELNSEQMALLDQSEKRYDRSDLQLDFGGQIVQAVAYIAQPESIDDNLKPTMEYLEHLMSGAREHSFPEEYTSLFFCGDLPHN